MISLPASTTPLKHALRNITFALAMLCSFTSWASGCSTSGTDRSYLLNHLDQLAHTSNSDTWQIRSHAKTEQHEPSDGNNACAQNSIFSFASLAVTPATFDEVAPVHLPGSVKNLLHAPRAPPLS